MNYTINMKFNSMTNNNTINDIFDILEDWRSDNLSIKHDNGSYIISGMIHDNMILVLRMIMHTAGYRNVDVVQLPLNDVVYITV